MMLSIYCGGFFVLVVVGFLFFVSRFSVCIHTYIALIHGNSMPSFSTDFLCLDNGFDFFFLLIIIYPLALTIGNQKNWKY